MRVEFCQSGESPEIGEFKRGETRDISVDIAKTLSKRKVLKIIDNKKEAKKDGK